MTVGVSTQVLNHQHYPKGDKDMTIYFCPECGNRVSRDANDIVGKHFAACVVCDTDYHRKDLVALPEQPYRVVTSGHNRSILVSAPA